jgi:hypothetical protein
MRVSIEKSTASYEVLSPWADADPITLRGLRAERPVKLEGKRIGLFHMWKRASKPILTVLEQRLKEKFPKATFSWYSESEVNTPEIESSNVTKYEDWLKGVDTAAGINW